MKAFLEEVYASYNHPSFISPDPLEVVLRYAGYDPGEEEKSDREIVGLIASSLALGRAASIVEAAENTVCRLLAANSGNAKSPGLKQILLSSGYGDFRELFHGFVYRFFREEHMAAFFMGIKRILEEWGSIEACWESIFRDEQCVCRGGSRFYREMLTRGEGSFGMLLSDPEKGSACKRLFLYLRWMVRRDRVDPGGWEGISAADLVIPLDTHMQAITRRLGFTKRKQADLKTALEVTRVFRSFSPEDPVKYDFSLSRFGIHPTLDRETLLSRGL